MIPTGARLGFATSIVSEEVVPFSHRDKDQLDTLLSDLTQSQSEYDLEKNEARRVHSRYKGFILPEQQYCAQHRERLKNFCLDDGEVICSDCAIFGRHQGHRIIKLQNFAAQFDNALGKVSDIQKQLANGQSDKKWTQFERELGITRSHLLEEIKRKREEVLKQLDQEYCNLVQKVERHFQGLEQKPNSSEELRDFQVRKAQWSDQISELFNCSPTAGHCFQLYNKIPGALAKGAELCAQRNSAYSSLLNNRIKKLKQVRLVPYENSLLGIVLSKEAQQPSRPRKSKMAPSRTLIQFQKREKDQQLLVSDLRLDLAELKQSRQKPARQLSSRSSNKGFTVGGSQGPKVPQRIRKHYTEFLTGRVEVLDFSNLQLSDKQAAQLLEPLRDNEVVKMVKLAKNQLTDQSIPSLLRLLSGSQVRSLNISQNTLTEKALDYLVEGLREPSQLRTVIMSMNKISLRQVRSKVEALKAKGVNVSL